MGARDRKKMAYRSLGKYGILIPEWLCGVLHPVCESLERGNVREPFRF